jgi:endonuclease/exonuclease/phosphatase (EEP) superfamily protein YafD
MDVKQKYKPSNAFKPATSHTRVKINSTKIPALPVHPYSSAATKTNVKHNFSITVAGIHSIHKPTQTTHKRS